MRHMEEIVSGQVKYPLEFNSERYSGSMLYEPFLEEPEFEGPFLEHEELTNVETFENNLTSSEDDEFRPKLDPQRDFHGISFQTVPGLEISFSVGQLFDHQQHFKNVLTDYMVRGGYKLKYLKNDKLRVTAICSENNCLWRIHASRLSQQETFMVKTITDEHTCLRFSNNRAATAKWISEKLSDLLRANPELDNETMKAALKEWGIDPMGWKLQRARKIARELHHGTFIESYAKLDKYCKLLIEKNEGTIVKLQPVERNDPDEQKIFWRCFVCFGALKEGFIKGCRPFFGLDGCHLKGPFGGTLLAAVALDGNNGIFPITWAIVDVENSCNWKWFLELLFETIAEDDRCKLLTIITDCQKGLGDMVEAIFPNSSHRRCAKHMAQNFKASFPGSALTSLFWEAAYATTRSEHHRALAKMRMLNTEPKKINGEMMGPATWLARVSASKWSRFAFDPDSKSPDITNNLCESFNSWILKIRGLPIIELLDMLRQKMMCRLHNNYSNAAECEDRVCPKIKKSLNTLTSKCRTLKILAARNNEYEVQERDKTCAVNINTRTCSCNMWQLSGVPCTHAVASLLHSGVDNIHDFVHDYYTVKMWKEANEGTIHPFPDEDLQPQSESDKYYPPVLKRRAGRPKKNRKRQEGEVGPSTRPHTVKCSTCGAIGHNKRGCQGAPVRQKRKRGTTLPRTERVTIGSRNEEGASSSRVKEVPRRGRARTHATNFSVHDFIYQPQSQTQTQ